MDRALGTLRSGTSPWKEAFPHEQLLIPLLSRLLYFLYCFVFSCYVRPIICQYILTKSKIRVCVHLIATLVILHLFCAALQRRWMTQCFQRAGLAVNKVPSQMQDIDWINVYLLCQMSLVFLDGHASICFDPLS